MIAQIFGGDDFIDSLNVFFEYFAAFFYPDFSCVKVAVPSTTPNHYNRL